jgi:hypothetical protein
MGPCKRPAAVGVEASAAEATSSGSGLGGGKGKGVGKRAAAVGVEVPVPAAKAGSSGSGLGMGMGKSTGKRPAAVGVGVPVPAAKARSSGSGLGLGTGKGNGKAMPEPGYMRITVVHPDSRLISLDVKPSDDVASVKAKLQDTLQMDRDFALSSCGFKIRSGSLFGHGILDGFTLTMHVDGMYIIFIDDGGNRELALLVGADTSIEEIKFMIEKRCGIWMWRLHLTWRRIAQDGQVAFDDETLGSMGIRAGDVITLRVMENPTTPEAMLRHFGRVGEPLSLG